MEVRILRDGWDTVLVSPGRRTRKSCFTAAQERLRERGKAVLRFKGPLAAMVKPDSGVTSSISAPRPHTTSTEVSS